MSSEAMKHAGIRVKRLRQDRGWSRADLAFRTRIGERSIYLIETGQMAEIKLWQAQALAAAFDVPLDAIFPAPSTGKRRPK